MHNTREGPALREMQAKIPEVRVGFKLALV